jgi:inhibitor of cysteine peptidase
MEELTGKENEEELTGKSSEEEQTEMLEMIRASAEDLPIPESLSPENMCAAIGKEKEERRHQKSKVRKLIWAFGIAAAACAAAVLIPVSLHLMKSSSAKPAAGTTAESVQKQTVGETEETAGETDSVFTAAADYESVYAALQKVSASAVSYMEAGNAAAEDAVSPQETDQKSAAAADAQGSASQEASSAESHSDTNLREKDVDEGDIVKTDGNYIYVLENNQSVRIVRADGGSLSDAGSISLDSSDSMSVLEMYVSGDRLVLIEQKWTAVLNEVTSENDVARDVYVSENQDQVTAVTYDISDRSHPSESGKVTCDGYYQSSRLEDGVLYLFTTYGNRVWACYDVMTPDMGTGSDVSDESDEYDEKTFLASGGVPEVNGNSIPSENIYIPQNPYSDSYLVMTSVRLSSPSDAVDSKAVLSWTDGIYVSSDAIYLYSASWMNLENDTSVVRFRYADGNFTEAGACEVPGTINDSFSIDESDDGHLRIAVTSWPSYTESTAEGTNTMENAVCIFDSEMNRTGELTGFAPGERIQSARFLNNICYIVTYKNTDPLFAIDLSSPENPVLLGELKIPGFSSYLHFWGEGRLFGLGMETDPDTSEVTGLKLSMFNISDPANVTEESVMIPEDAFGADALYNYKALLIDPEKNIIGFGTYYASESEEDYTTVYDYRVFSYRDGNFVNVFRKELADDEDNSMYNTRGIYIGNTFYLVCGSSITAYDMNDSYQQIGEYNG